MRFLKKKSQRLVCGRTLAVASSVLAATWRAHAQRYMVTAKIAEYTTGTGSVALWLIYDSRNQRCSLVADTSTIVKLVRIPR